MSRTFQVKTIPSRWLDENGRRLDCGPYMSGAIEARELIKHLHTERLDSLTAGHKGGIYNGSPFIRNYVNDPDHGVPFLTTSSMLQADLTNISFLSKKDATSNKLSFLEVKEKMTLITCSGSIGRMAYARKDMEGSWSNQDILKVVADEEKIKPCYLYAYLGSCFGIPLVISGTYGAIIQHIEPEHISSLPVPRLGEIEDQVHELVQKAAESHVKSVQLRREAAELLNDICGFPQKMAPMARNFAFSSASSSDVFKRLDATFHNPIAQKAEQLTADADGISLYDAGITGFESNRMKQVFVEPGFGTPFITSGGIFSKTIEPERYLRNQLLGDESSWRINQYDSLIARSGQVGGIIGRGVWADSRLDGFAASPHILRIRSEVEDFPPGYLYTFLCLTDVGYQLLARTAAGSSIPFLPLDEVLKIKIPQRPTIEQRIEIDSKIKESGELRKEAQQFEKDAVLLVENAIKEGGR